MTPKEIVEYYEGRVREALREIDVFEAYEAIRLHCNPDKSPLFLIDHIDANGAVKMVVNHLPNLADAQKRWVMALMWVMEIDPTPGAWLTERDLYYLTTATDSEKLAACLIVLAEEQK